jgi:hypothetical protein
MRGYRAGGDTATLLRRGPEELGRSSKNIFQGRRSVRPRKLSRHGSRMDCWKRANTKTRKRERRRRDCGLSRRQFRRRYHFERRKDAQYKGVDLRMHCARKDAQYTRGLYSKCIAQSARKSRACIAHALRILWPDRPYGPCRPIAHLVRLGVAVSCLLGREGVDECLGR